MAEAEVERNERWMNRVAIFGIVAIIVLFDGNSLAVGMCGWVCGHIFGWVDRGRAIREEDNDRGH